MTLIYSFTIIYPIFLTYGMRILGSDKGVSEVICIFGYSIIMYIPATFLAIIPYKVFYK